MYRRVPCDWFLCDGMFRPVRLDAPMLILEVLEDTGVIPTGGTFTERLATEWVYRRTWTYSAKFLMSDENDRTFIKLTGISGAHAVLLNGEPVTESECEITGGLKGENSIGISFPPAACDLIRPVYGFGGMLMYRKTKGTAITAFEVKKDGSCEITVDSLTAAGITIKYSMTCGGNRLEGEFTEKATAGVVTFTHKPFESLPQNARCDITAQVYIKTALSDEVTQSIFVSGASAAPRGLVTSGEVMIGVSAKLGANSVFTRSEKPDGALGLLSARHSLACVTLDGITPSSAENALAPEERLLEIAGREDMLKQNALWGLTDTDRACYDRAKELVPSGELEEIVRVSRYLQAAALQSAALNARANGKPFVLEAAEAVPGAPASKAIMDDDRSPRPAYCALKNAWRAECGYTRINGAVSDDGIFSCEVMYVSDSAKAAGIKVTAFDINGKPLNSSSYAALDGMCTVGRFITEMPPEGVCIIRTQLTEGSSAGVYTDEIVMKPGVGFESLPVTQLLVTQEKVINAGSCAALGVSIGAAGYFGCLLPGEEIACDKADGAEGLNVYF